MKRFHLSKLTFLLAPLLALTLMTSQVAAAAPSWNGGTWRIVSSPNMGSDNNSVTALSAISSNDVWATGSFTLQGTQVSHALIEHWNGSRWSIVPSPNPGTRSYSLKAVSAVSTNNVWAVGFTSKNINGGNQKTLIEHWDGSNWSIVPSPNPGQLNFLLGAVALSSSNVWAVGLSISNSLGSPLIEHWDGSQWSVVASPNSGSNFSYLVEARAVSANDIWAVGNFTTNNGVFQTRTEHWDGSQWSIVPSPNVGSHDNFLNSVTTVSTDDVWAVGTSTNNSNTQRTLVEHWNGSQWSVVPSPNVGSHLNALYDVGAVSSNDIWTIGQSVNNSNVAQTLIQHWDGSKWRIVSSPNSDLGSNIIQGLTVVSANEVWAVGEYSNSSNVNRTLIEHCC
jgi:hypothetical protein